VGLPQDSGEMKTIVTLTINPAVDKNASISQVIDERKLRCTRPSFEPGGGGINVSRAIQKLGGGSDAYYLAGGPTGDMLESLLAREGLRHHRISIKDWTRENLTIYEEMTGRQFRFGMPGPDVSQEEWQACLNQLVQLDSPPDYLVASGSLSPGIPDDFYARLARALKGNGKTRVLVDTSGEALSSAAKEGVYLIKSNLREFSELMWCEFKHESEQYEAASRLIQQGACEILVVSLGAQGALLVTKEGHWRFRSPIVPIQSRVGAGDSMMAGIVLSLSQDRSIEDATLFGIAAGAAACMTPGSELCRREDTERLFQEMKQETLQKSKRG